jgi:hypothetical protein
MIQIAPSWLKDTSTHLTTETGSVWQALERLCKGIRDEQAEGREGEDWNVAKRYIRSALQGLP